MWGEFFKKQRGLDSYLPYKGFVEKGVMQLKNEGFLVTYEIRGKDLSSSTNFELGQISRGINAALMKLGDGWMAHIDTVRLESKYYPQESECFFPDVTTKLIDAYRRSIFESSETCFENKYYLNLTYTPSILSKKNLYSILGIENNNKTDQPSIDKILNKFLESVNKFLNLFSTYIYVTKISDEEILTYLHFCITGLTHKVSSPLIPMYLDTILASRDFFGGMKPKIGNKHIRTISIKGFPSYLLAGLLEVLDSQTFEYRFSSRFIFLDQFSSRKKIEKVRKDWDQSKLSVKSIINDQIGSTTSTTFASGDSIIMMHDADAAVQDNQANELGFGYYTPTIIIMNENEEIVDDNASKVLKALEDKGLPCFVETRGSVEAWLGSHPGNSWANGRHPMISTHNLTHFIPITAVWAGEARHPNDKYMDRITGKKPPPMFYAATQGRTPFRVSLSVKDVGHTMLIGATGAGKTALLAFIIAQFFRYKNAQVFSFDKDHCLLVLCTAAGGSHFELSVNKSSEEDKYSKSVSFCPLAHIDNAEEKSWAIEWISSLVQLQHDRSITVQEQDAIAQTIDIMSKETHASHERTLSKFQSQIQNHDVRQALKAYVREDMYGAIFNGESDFISESKFNVFEMSSLMNNGEKILVPALMYIFMSIKKRLTGAPTLLVLDEAWTFFRHGIFAKKIEEWLRELRRFNCSVIFATQSINEIKNSSILPVILESCKTKIYLPNSQVLTNKEIYAAYESFGLNEKQISIIANAIPKREYYLNSEDGNRLFEVLLDKLTLAFVGVADRDEITRATEIMKQEKENWIEAWLTYKKVQPDWIDYVKELKAEFEEQKNVPDTRKFIQEFMNPSKFNDEVSHKGDAVYV